MMSERMLSFSTDVIFTATFTCRRQKRRLQTILEIIKELDKKPITINVLNTRVDTARDLVLKIYTKIPSITTIYNYVNLSAVRRMVSENCEDNFELLNVSLSESKLANVAFLRRRKKPISSAVTFAKTMQLK